MCCKDGMCIGMSCMCKVCVSVCEERYVSEVCVF